MYKQLTMNTVGIVIVFVLVSYGEVRGQPYEIFYDQLTTGEPLQDNDIIIVQETQYNDSCNQFPADQVGVTFTRGETVTGWKSLTMNPLDSPREQDIMWRMESELNIGPHTIYFKHETLYPNRLCLWFEDRGIGDQRTCKYIIQDAFAKMLPQTLHSILWVTE